ncbi:MAG: hypothetical protein HOP29_07670 [Phycisphaerales bacterium]|nr:hypothetical protein [Phycisphaerales bacterium]
MANDYIPRADAEFDGWQANFVAYANAHLADLGLVAGDIAPVLTATAEWGTAYAAHVSAAAAAHAARQTKDGRRSSLEALIRGLVRRLQAGPAVDDAERQALGITVRDAVPTIAGPPVTRPVVRVEPGQRLRHVVAFTDEATPTRTARPAGVMGAEVWVKIGGPPPVDPGECTFLALDTRTPYMAEYSGADGNKTAHYLLRWVSTRGDKGPWSETASATIGA